MTNHLKIETKETITREIDLEIGVDITEEKANELIKMVNESKKPSFPIDSKEYSELECLLPSDWSWSSGFEDVEIHIEDENGYLVEGEEPASSDSN